MREGTALRLARPRQQENPVSVALMQIYDHFRHARQTNLKDENLACVANFAARILGENAVLDSLTVEKTESKFHDDDGDFEEPPHKKVKPDIPYTLDEAPDLEQGQPLTFNWRARSANGEEILTGDGESALDVTTVMVDAEVNHGDMQLHVRIQFTDDVRGPLITLVITGTSAQGFFKQWASDTWQPQLENIAIADPALVCCSGTTLFRHEDIFFPLQAGISVILRATPGENLRRIIEGIDRLYLFGLLLDGDFKDVRPYLKSFPFFHIKLGESIGLDGCYFDISTRTPTASSRKSESGVEEEEDGGDEEPFDPVPFAQLNLAGNLSTPENILYLWTDVPADNEVLAFRLAGPGYQLCWRLDELAPVLGTRSGIQDTFASGIRNGQDWKYRIIGLEYFYDLSMHRLYSLSTRLELLDKGASLFPHGVKVGLEQLTLHCNVGAPDTHHALSLWAEGIGNIDGILMPMNISWANGISLIAGNDGPPPENLYSVLTIDQPVLAPEVAGLASYRVEFAPDGPPRLSILPFYKRNGIDVEDDEDDSVLSDDPIILSGRTQQ